MTPQETVADLVDTPSKKYQLGSNQEDGSTTDPMAVELLQAIQSAEKSAETLGELLGIPRQRVYRVLNPFVEIGLVRKDAGFVLTGAGHAMLQAYERATSSVDPEDIGYLARSTYREQILRKISDRPTKRKEIGEGENAPSGSTIRRSLSELKQREWIAYDETNRIQTTETGSEVLESFECLIKATEQIIEKEPFLRRLGSRSTELPFTALSNADLVVATPENPHAPLSAAMDKTGLKAAVSGETTVDQIRTVCPVFSPAMFDVFGQFVDFGTKIEVVYDAETRQAMCEKKHLHYLAGSIAAPNVDIRFLSESLTFGVGLYDGTGMAVAYNNREGHEAGITTQDVEVNDWIERVFDEYWEQGEAPSEYALGRVRRYLKRNGNRAVDTAE